MKTLHRRFSSMLNIISIQLLFLAGSRSWNSNTLATWVKNWLIWKDPDAGKGWGQEEKGMTEDEMVGWPSLTQWAWVWVDSRSWWWTGKPGVLQWWTGRPGVLQFMGSQRVRHDWATELNWEPAHNTLAISSLEISISSHKDHLLKNKTTCWLYF